MRTALLAVLLVGAAVATADPSRPADLDAGVADAGTVEAIEELTAEVRELRREIEKRRR